MRRYFTDRAENEIWRRDLATMSWLHRTGVKLVRYLWVIARDVAEGQLTLRAMGLVYTTLLALVPLLAFSFAVLRAFGAHNQLEPVLNRILMGLGDRGPEITLQIIGFVDNIRVGLLGSVGLVILLYTVISLVQKIEDGFNYAWRVPKGRSLTRRFSGYISVITVGPVLIFGALGVIGMAQSQAAVEWVLEQELFGPVLSLAARLLPIVMVAAAFTLFYVLVPNTRVRVGPAAVGGLIAAVLWEVIGTAFAGVVVASGRYTAIYATFAAPLLFMLWLYLSWMILLLGTQIAFYVQNPQFITPRRGALKLDHALKEHLALSVMYLVAHRWRGTEPRWSFDALSRKLNIDSEPLSTVIDRLLARGLLVLVDDTDAFAPGRDPETITLHEIIDALRHDGGIAGLAARGAPKIGAVDEIQTRVDDAVRDTLAGLTLRDIIVQRDQAGGT